MKFTEVVLASDDLDRAQASLYLAGCDGVVERLEEHLPVAAAFFLDRGRAETASRMLGENGISHRLIDVSADDDPMSGFRAAARPFTVGRFRIDPRDESAPPDYRPPGLIGLRVPASCAFGTGLHESTAAILRFLGDSALEGRRVLDVGCGSGILAIAASALGASFCCAFDLDCDAVFEARRNLARNPSTGRGALFAGPIEAIQGSFDLVLANMIFEEVAPLIPAIVRLLAPQGAAVFSGILDARESDARAAIEAGGLRIEAVETSGEWRLIVAAATR